MNKRWLLTHLLPIFLVVILVGGITIAAVPSFKNKFVGYIKQFGPKADETYSWQITTIDSPGRSTYNGSIAVDSQDHPHISYRLSTNYGHLMHAYYNGSEWKTEIAAPGYGYTRGLGSSIALDGDTPHISHCEQGAKWLTHTSWNGAEWIDQRLSPPSCSSHYTSLALGSNAQAHISYYNNLNHSLNYVTWNGTGWGTNEEIEKHDGQDGARGLSNSLALDSNGNPHISYWNWQGYSNTEYKLQYAYKNGSQWKIETVDSEGEVGIKTSLALDSDNRPHIAYLNNGLKYAHWDGSQWKIETVSGDVGGYISLALDSDNRPHIAYLNNGLKYAHWDGSQWKIETVSGDVGGYISLALDKNNRAHISYGDTKNTQIKYATNILVDATPPISSINNLDEFYNQQGLPKELTGASSDASGVAKVEVKIQREDDSKFWDDASETWTDEEKWHQTFGTNNWTWPIEKLAKGLEDTKKYLVTFRATDASSKSNVEGDGAGKNQKTFSYDVSAPSASEKVNNGSDANEKWTAHKSQLLANWSEANDNISGIAGYQYAIGATPGGTETLDWTDNGNKTSAHAANLSLSENQTYYFSVRAVDKAGNVGAATTSDGIKVVKQLFPSILISTSPQLLTNYSTPQIVGNAESWTDNISLIEYKIDNGEWTKLQPLDEKYDSTLELFNFNTPKLDEGQHIIYIRSTDSSGHATEEAQYAKAEFDLDLTKPAAPTISSIKSNEVLNTSRPTFSGTATPSNLILLTVSSEIRKYLASVGLDGAWSYQVPEPLEEGAHSLQIVERDIAGNESDATTISFSVKTIEDIIPVPGAPAPISIITSAPTATSSTTTTSTTAAPTSTSVSTTTSSAPTPSESTATATSTPASTTSATPTESTTTTSTATTSAATPTTSAPTSVFLPQPTFVENPTFPETIIIINNDEEIIKDSSQEEQKVSTKPNSQMEISVTPTHDDKTVKSVTAVFAGNTYELTDKNNSGSYSTDLLSPSEKGSFPAKTTIAYDDGTIEEIQTTILVDALHGFIYEGKEKKIEGAKITLYVWQDNNWQVWQSESKQENPQTTQNDGVYSFAAPTGKYYLTVEKQGYKTYKSKEMTINEVGETKLNIKLSKPIAGSIVTYAIILIIIGGAVLAYKKYSKKNSYTSNL